MFQPRSFVESNRENISELVRDYPLGTLIVSGNGEYDVNHLPFVSDFDGSENLILRAHMPKANPLVELLGSETLPCVVIFQGANGYITPSWYSTKQKNGKVVPTWNYAVVHVHGYISLAQDGYTCYG